MLQITPTFGDLGTWIQAITGIVALILSIVTALQHRKIQELTDITIALTRQTEELSKQTLELQEQTKIHARRYELEADIALYNQIPNFRFVGEGQGEPSYINTREPVSAAKFKIELMNVGNAAHKIDIEFPMSEYPNLDFGYASGTLVPKGKTVRVFFYDLNIPVTEKVRIVTALEGYTFKILFDDDLGRRMFQEITINQYGFNNIITRPQWLI